MLFTGVDLLTLTKVLEDSRERYETATPSNDLPVSSIDLPDEGKYRTVYKDGMAIKVYPIGADQTIKIATASISPDVLETILNGREDSAYIDIGLSGVNYYALGFRLKNDNGTYDYYSFLKGVITVNTKTVETMQGTSVTVEGITYYPLITRHSFAYNGKPCRKIVANSQKHNIIEAGWRAIQWTPDTFLPVPAPLITIEEKGKAVEVTVLSQRPSDTIYYTIDGTIPTLESAQYIAPFTVEENTKIKAIACAPSKHISAVAVADINIIRLLGYNDNRVGYNDNVVGY